MSALSTSVAALSGAQTRFQRASETLVRAVSGEASSDAGAAVAEMIEARVEAKGAIQIVRFSDEMFKALIEIGR